MSQKPLFKDATLDELSAFVGYLEEAVGNYPGFEGGRSAVEVFSVYNAVANAVYAEWSKASGNPLPADYVASHLH